MMNDQVPTPNEQNPLNELSETLRPAVEQVRAATPPGEAVERSLDRAQQLGPPRRRSRSWKAWTTAAGIAAGIIVAFGVWTDRSQKAPPAVALNQREKNKQVPAEKAGSGRPNRAEPYGPPRFMSPGTRGDEKNRGEVLSSDWGPSDQMNEDTAQGRSAPGGMAMRTRVRCGDIDGRSAPGGMASPRPTVPPAAVPPMQTGGFAGGFQAQGNMGNGGIVGYGGQQPGNNGMMGVPNNNGTTDTTGGRASVGMGGMMMGGMGMNGGMMGMMGMMGGMPPGMPRESREQELKETRKLLEKVKATIRKQELIKDRTPGDQRKEAELARASLRKTQELATVLQTRIKELESQAETKPGKKQPQVWHRDRSRPTFARVYVGDGNSLELVSLHVSVTIEGPRARTVVDHVFRNPHNRQLEGTFEYPLPSGASPSYFAMFLGQTRDTVPVRFARRGGAAPLPTEALARLTPEELVKHVDTTDWGRLQEARIVSKDKALETYEDVVRGRIDPALLEYSGGNTFSGRVFPIPAKGYNRVILAYEELLPFAQEHMIYRFPLPNRKLQELQFTLHANAAECLKPSLLPPLTQPSPPLGGEGKREGGSGRVTFTRTWKDSKPEGEVLFACTPANDAVQSISGRQDDNGPRYVYARLRPHLKALAKDNPFASHAVFLLDTSLSEHPERFAHNVELLRKILETDRDIKSFNVLTFNVAAAWLNDKAFFDNTPAGREKALKKLDGLVLEGATDVSRALDTLAEANFDLAAGTPLNVFLLSDGHVTWGEPDVATLVARFEQRCRYATRFHCYRLGLGEENSELFEALTRRGGGVFQCYGEAELEAAAKAHRSQCLHVKRVRFVGGPAAGDVLVSGRKAAVYPDGELVVAARFNGTGRTTVVVEGEFAGKPMVQEFPLEVRSGSELAPRAWAEVAVASLLALHDSNYDSLVTAYCQQFGIVSRVASFLVLENEADYKRLNLQDERGKTISGDLGDFLADAWTRLGKATPAGKAFQRFLNQVNQRVHLFDGAQGAHVKQLLAALTEEDFELPTGQLRGGLVYQKDAAGYVAERERERRNVRVYLMEARRRAESGDVDGAVRVLSSIIEEYPSRGDALRLVGYRLLDFQQGAQAARLFSQVQKQRPFEPHSYRDLAHALEQSGRYGLAALNYEIVLAGNWHARFRQELKLVAEEEYAHLMQEAIRHKKIAPRLANLFGERLEQMRRPQPKSDLRVTISWNTDATDVDLWVIEPDGTKCFYQHNRTPNGGELSQDQTQGYGPERYQIAKAQPGTYTVLVHYFRPNPNLLAGETHVSVTVTRFAGTPREQSERHTVILKKHDQQVEVCKLKF